ncbi:MAG: RnfABCDGE type electron transport complex subunit D [Candidatus Riflebacteria bacterium]|nr:RnfABCDGE type electron transport complex subunit D [Candidatus Riflebacteria bacterium]
MKKAAKLLTIKRTDLMPDICVAVFLFFYYFSVFGRFGQKFAAAVAVSVGTGLVLGFFRILFNFSGKDTNDFFSGRFGWLLFFAFPLFFPLSLSLWLIPFVLVSAYLICFGAFGGFKNHFFNPVILAVVFMMCGYGYTSVLNVSRPLPVNSGYKTWTSGMPVSKPLWKIYASVPLDSAVKASVSSHLPSVPGASRGAVILLFSLLFSFIFKRRRLWLIGCVCFTVLFSYLITHFVFEPALGIKSFYPLLFGFVPIMLFVGVYDFETISQGRFDQLAASLIFSFFAVMFSFNTENVYLPVYAFLIMQILTPLISDIKAMFVKAAK